MEFVHLHVNTEFSLLQSAAKIDTLVKKAKALQYEALAITDRNVMYGVVPFYKACKKNDLKPIIGLELNLKSEFGEETAIILLAKSNKGYQNLLKLSSIAQVVGTEEKKYVEDKFLFSYCDELVLISTPYHGKIKQHLLANETDLAAKVLNRYIHYFGEDFYLAIQDHLLAEEKQINLHLMELAKNKKLKLVALNQVMYIEKKDSLAHKCLLAIDQGTTINHVKTECLTDEYYLKSKNEMSNLFSFAPEVLHHTIEIKNKCNVELQFGEQALPKYPLPTGENAKDYLKSICLKGLQARYEVVTEEHVKRLSYELSIIDQMKFNDYFLIVWDFMKFAHDKKMITGPGRGSAAGSLVAYVLQITNVDPIKYDLLFERFLNPERITMPDIDIDFPDTKREEVIEYVFQKYGKNHVAQIITFGTLAAKAAIRDVGKVLGIPLKQIDSIAKQISSRPNLTIKEVLEETPFLKKQLEENDDFSAWFDLAERVEGIPRHASTHAAGIVISSDPLTDKVPLQKGHGNVYLTQYPMTTLEEIGLLKMDFLGLRNLSFIEEILSHIYQTDQVKIDLDLISFTDKKTYELLSKGDTTGVFQLESAGMRRVLTNLKPTEFEDIVAVNALYRPGPMDNIPDYIAGKHKKRQVTYIHNDLKPILEKTYSVIIYQEQIMQIASTLAGFSLGEADILRRAVSKKKLETLEEQRTRFIEGCIKRGYTKEIGHEVYDLIVRFANYGFNRSHSVAYSMISYQLAYLKANYPAAFYTALLTSAIGQYEKTKEYIADAKKKEIIVTAPSINKSFASFTLDDSQKIQFGLAAIKNVGLRAIEDIVIERSTGGNFTSVFDFCARVSLKFINRRTLESLVSAGCFDEFNFHRASLLATLDYAIEYGEQVRKRKEDTQTSLFHEEVKKPEMVAVPPFQETEKLYFEKEVLGFYLSSHLIENYLEVVNSHNRSTIVEVIDKNEKMIQRLAGLIETVRIVKTKKGEQMGFITLSDETGEIDVTVFPKQFREFFHLLKVGSLLFLEGKVEEIKERYQFIISKATEVKTLQKKKVEKKIYLKIDYNHASQQQLIELKELLKKHPGNLNVILYYEEKKQSVQLSDDFQISASNQCLEALYQMLGRGNVVIK